MTEQSDSDQPLVLGYVPELDTNRPEGREWRHTVERIALRLLLDGGPPLRAAAIGDVDPADFDGDHRVICEALIRMHRAGIYITAKTLRSEVIGSVSATVLDDVLAPSKSAVPNQPEPIWIERQTLMNFLGDLRRGGPLFAADATSGTVNAQATGRWAADQSVTPDTPAIDFHPVEAQTSALDRYFLLPDPADSPELDQLIRRLTHVAEAWAGRADLTQSDRVFAMYSLGGIAGALAATFDEGQLDSATALMESTIAIAETLQALRDMVGEYIALIERSPHWFRKPHRDNPRPTGVSGLPEEVELKRRLASDAEVGRYMKQTSQIYKFLAEQLDIAIRHSVLARSYADRFHPPDAPWVPDVPETPTALYFWYDASDVLLYIGITGDLATRQTSHAKRSSWSEFADHSKIRRFPSRPEAESAEKSAIEAERPLFNRQHNDTPEARQRLVAYLVEHGRMDLLAPAVSRG
ncbi:hypothetical protein AB0J14_05100 [Micromonospora arborensis]|uniref:hypothetical protein n=1 Tax=Micromonospora arborensis TaxID=2116518 RepID=UPI0033C43407